MRTRRVLGPIWVSLTIFALPAAAQTPDGYTPAEESICNTADFANATPGLQGLCIAMCEAQDCKATMEEEVQADGTVITTVKFSPSCNASAPQILENYNKIRDRDADDTDPPMPCVEAACPCWSEEDIENMASASSTCYGGDNWGVLSGIPEGGGWEQASVSQERVKGNVCNSIQVGSGDREKADMSTLQYSACMKSLRDECTQREKPWPPAE